MADFRRGEWLALVIGVILIIALVPSGWRSLGDTVAQGFGDAASSTTLSKRSITIRAIDQSGQPVPGILISRRFTPRQWLVASIKTLVMGGDGFHWKALGLTTSPSGSFTWNDLDRAVQNSKKDIAGIRFRARVPGHEEVSVEFDSLPAHGSTIDLQLPRAGELRVRILDPLGQPILGMREIRLELLHLDLESGEWKHRSRGVFADQENRVGYQECENGIAIFPAVALDQMFRVSINIPSLILYGPFNTQFGVLELIDGPTAANPSVTHDLQLGDDLVLLSGRALDAKGQALNAAMLIARLNTKTYGMLDRIRCQADGRFTVVFPSLTAGADLEITDARRENRFDLRRFAPFKKGILDLGDVILAAKPILVAGRAIPATDAPCQDYRVIVEHRLHSATPWEKTRYNWGSSGGDFRITGTAKPGDYRLQVIPTANCHIMPDPVAFLPGTENLEVRLERGHTLVVVAQAAGGNQGDWINRNMHSFRMTLIPTDGNALAQNSAEGQGRIKLTNRYKRRRTTIEHYGNGLTVGTYRLEVSIKGATTPFRTISGIQIPDPSGNLASVDLDLSQDLKEVVLRWRPTDGSSWNQSARATLHHQGRIINAFGWKNETVSLLVRPGTMDLWVRIPGYMPVYLQGLSTDQDVLLTPSSTPLRVSLASRLTLPDNTALRINLEATAQTPPGWQIPKTIDTDCFGRDMMPFYTAASWPTNSHGMFDSGGRARLEAHRAGPQTITLELIPTSAAVRTRWNRATIPIAVFSPKSFDLQPSTSTQTLTLQVTQAVIDAALRDTRIR